nr:methyl-accepting chemotaxis protein [uncultured Gellertiella sp.]
MSRPSIKVFVTSAFALVAVLFAAFGYVALSGMQVINGSTLAISQVQLPAVEAIKDAQVKLMQKRLAFIAHVAASSPDELAKATAKAEDAKTAANAAIDAYGRFVSSDAQQKIFSDIKTNVLAFDTAAGDMLALSSGNHKAEAARQFNEVMVPIGAKVMDGVSALVKMNLESARLASDTANQTYESARDRAIVALVIGLLVTVAAVSYAVREVSRAITRISAAMRDLASGNTASEIPYRGRSDEIGVMAGAVEVFRNAVIHNRQMEMDAEAARQLAGLEQRRVAEEAEESARIRLEQATSGLATGLRRLAAGDLSFELRDAFSPEFEMLRHDLNSAVARLRETLLIVAESTVAIDGGAREISTSANNLSQRTEQQAASLEETAAALDEITVNVANSSKRAEEARMVAGEANASAEKSALVVSSAENAMRRIEESSAQISSIIGVIDEIAFQTNLLALNAGVEAARAGEAGKGFAVVAQEVRELAQRSAKAAKEIKELISHSSQEVGNGVKLVRDTGEALKTIEGFIVTINAHMDSIATSSREQAVGLSEVNTAVNQMDQMTQQNAAMVEETNAASATLAEQSSQLRQTIGHFELGAQPGCDIRSSGQATALKGAAQAMQRAAKPSAPQPAGRTLNAARTSPRPAPAQGNLAVAQEGWSEF